MNELQIFDNPEFGKVRMAEIYGKPYAVGVDVARALGYADPKSAVRAHCRGMVTYPLIDNLGRKQEATFIPEGDIYRLIVKAADQSRNEEIKEKAERFEKWVFDEVIPAIRKTGYYSTQEEVSRLVERALGKRARLSLTDVIRDKGLNDQMHGYAYKNYTDLAYKAVLGMAAKKYMTVNGITGNLRDHLNRFQLQKLDEVEQLEKALLQMNYTYDEVKTIILSKKITGSGEVRALKEG